jgi:5'-methylthioadenosine phosphorylase
MIGLITGSGLYDIPDLTNRQVLTFHNPYGLPVTVTTGTWNGHDVCFVPRHGSDHSVPPHAINYRGTIAGLKQAGATAVLATAAVGAITPLWPSGTLAVVTDFINLTSGRPDTFFDAVTEPMAGIVPSSGVGDGGESVSQVVHTDMSEPYDPRLRAAIVAAAERIGVAIEPSAVYCCANGPRFETKAEISMMGRLGGQVVGMTGYPEVALAVEAGLPYASIALVSNPAAGVGADAAIVSVDEVVAMLRRMAGDVYRILEATVHTLSDGTGR